MDSFRDTFVKKLAYYMSVNGKNQMDIMNDLHLSSSTVSSWCTGKKLPRMDKIQMLADYFHVLKSDLLEDDAGETRRGPAVNIPVFGTIAAGIPIEMISDIVDEEEITPEMAARGEYFGLRIRGNSMAPRLEDGDVVLFKAQNTAETGDIVAVTANGNEACCKRLKRFMDGIALISLNPDYDPMFFTNKEIETLPVTILGKAVEVRRKL